MRLAKQLAVEILTRIEATMPIALETDLFSKVASYSVVGTAIVTVPRCKQNCRDHLIPGSRDFQLGYLNITVRVSTGIGTPHLTTAGRCVWIE